MVTILAALPSKYSTWIGWGVVALFMLGTVVRNRDWQNSEAIFVRTLEAEPNIARIQLDLANILLNRGDDNGAYTHLDAGLRSMEGGKYSQLPDDFYRAHIGLGAILARARKYGEAREHLEAARKVNPEGEWSYLYLGAIDMEADNNLPRALEQLQKAVKLGPVNEVAQDYLGMVLFNLGRFREAKTAFEKALEINPTFKDARAHLEAANRSLAE
jgi:tetratricopeptide (TPR) repeat protein